MSTAKKPIIEFPSKSKIAEDDETYIQAWVPNKYWLPVLKDLSRRKIKIREFLELCVKLYLLQHLPDTAKKLGLSEDQL